MNESSRVMKKILTCSAKTLTVLAASALYIAGGFLLLMAGADWRTVFTSQIMIIAFTVFLVGWCLAGRARKRVFVASAVIAAITAICTVCTIFVNVYEHAVTIRDLPFDQKTLDERYSPFDDDSDIARLEDEPDFNFGNAAPVLHAQPQYYPLASSFVNAYYSESESAEDCLDARTFLSTAYPQSGLIIASDASIKTYYGDNASIYGMTTVALDPLVFYTHKNATVTDLSTKELEGILGGEITDWREVGGKNKKIKLYTKHDVTTQSNLISQSLNVTPTTGETQIEFNPVFWFFTRQSAYYRNEHGAIGFAFLSEIQSNPEAYSNTRALTIDGVSAYNYDAVRKGQYPLCAEIAAFTQSPMTENEKQLTEIMLSPDGQSLVEKSGLIPVK